MVFVLSGYDEITDDTGVIRATCVTFPQMELSPNVLSVIFHKWFADRVSKIGFVWPTVECGGGYCFSVYRGIKNGRVNRHACFCLGKTGDYHRFAA